MFNDINLKGVSLSTWARGIALIVVCVLSLLNSIGVINIDFDEGNISETVEFLVGAFVVLSGFWKNNSFTANAQKADAFLDELREDVQG